MTSKIVELEVELESMERQHTVDVKSLEIMRQAQIKSDESLQNKIGSWKTTESAFEEKIASLEGRVISLEQEVLLLYSKNLEMAQQLGELEP
jgi:predicted  nucleic acid-binding Zn-ribbon protein